VRLRKRYLPLAAVLGAALVILPTIASSATSTETVEALAPYSWSPASAIVTSGGTILFKNKSGITHGIIWTGGTAGGEPACNTGAGNNIPIGVGKWSTSWEGSCTFSKTGTYTYECSYHMALMRGTITVATPGAPVVSSGQATSLSETEATLKGTVNPEGKATTYFFNYGTSTSYGSKTIEESAGEESTTKPAAIPVSSLSPGTTYHFQLVAKNTTGTTFGEDETFTTLSPPGSPTATTGVASAISETEATLKGTVNPDGLATSYFFEWGTGGSYTQKTAELAVGEDHSSHTESAIVSGLASGETYNFRIVAKNASGPATGAAQSFTTARPPSPTPTTPTPTTPTATTSTQPSGGQTSTSTSPLPVTVPGPSEPPPGGARSIATLALAGSQHGGAVHGSIQIPAADSGARLEVELLAQSATLAKAKRSGSSRVGRFVRSSAAAGKLSFSVSLDAQAKRALRRHHKLELTLKIVLTPKHGAATTITRNLLLRP
jgi:plastocyanin